MERQSNVKKVKNHPCEFGSTYGPLFLCGMYVILSVYMGWLQDIPLEQTMKENVTKNLSKVKTPVIKRSESIYWNWAFKLSTTKFFLLTCKIEYISLTFQSGYLLSSFCRYFELYSKQQKCDSVLLCVKHFFIKTSSKSADFQTAICKILQGRRLSMHFYTLLKKEEHF